MSRNKELDSAQMVAALKETLTVEDAGRLLGCSAPSFRYRAKEDDSIALAIKEQKDLKEASIAEALVVHKGILSKVAEALGFSSGMAVRYHIARSPHLTQVFDAVRDGVVDLAEDNIFSAVETGDLRYSWKVLTTLGKDRGYTERKEINSNVVHSTKNASSSDLVGILNGMANTDPNVIEAEFETLAPEERALLAEALQDHTEETTEA